MKTYELKTKSGEVINKVNANDKVEATEMFAEIKQLGVKSLQSLFIVELETK